MGTTKEYACASCGKKMEGKPKDFSYRIPLKEGSKASPFTGPTLFMHDECAKRHGLVRITGDGGLGQDQA